MEQAEQMGSSGALRVTVSGCDGPVHLTRREIQVIEYLASGMTQYAGARMMGIRPSSFHTCTMGIHQKLGVSSRGRLISTALAYDIISLERLRELLASHTE